MDEEPEEVRQKKRAAEAGKAAQKSTSKVQSGHGGYGHVHTDEELRRWRAVPVEQKLAWLEEVNRFFDQYASPEAKRVRELFRKGEI